MTEAGNGGVCYGPQQTATDWTSAFLNCVNSGLLRLPTFGELTQILTDVNSRNGGTTNEEDWTEDHNNGTADVTTLQLVGFTFSINSHPIGDSVGYRCVTNPHNNLGSVPTAPTNNSNGYKVSK
jgi:hypothetical protein